MWIVYNPDLSAVGVPHPRPNPAEGRVELQIEGLGYTPLSDEEKEIWNLSPGFKSMVDSGRLVLEEAEMLPSSKPTIPPSIKPRNQYDAEVAFQIAMQSTGREAQTQSLHDLQMDRVNVFAEDDLDRIKVSKWKFPEDEPEARVYVKTRHHEVLAAARWYLEDFVEKRTTRQDQRLRAIKARQEALKELV